MIRNHPKILIVEDQNIVALDLQNSLEKLNYEVSGIAFSGVSAIKKVQETKPDLVLMDITLKGEMDGISTADEIKKRFDIPLIYITAYADEGTLQRAKLTEPFGYIIKPFEEKDLHRMIELALQKSKSEKELKNSEYSLKSTINSFDYGIFKIDKYGYVTFANNYLLNIIEYDEYDIIGRKISKVLDLLKIERDIDIDNKIILENNKYPKKIQLISKSGEIKLLSQKVLYDTDPKGSYSGLTVILEKIENNIFNKNNKILSQIDFLTKIESNTSNDILNILTGILGNLHLVINETKSVNFNIKKIINDNNIKINDNDKFNLDTLITYLSNISFYSHKLKNIVQNVFSFSEEIFVHKKIYSLEEIVYELKKRKSEVNFISNINNISYYSVYIDKELIYEAIENIIMNANESMDFSEKVTIIFSIEVVKNLNYIKISIKDNGCGIEKEDFIRVFEPYFSTKDSKGLGLTKAIINISKNDCYVKFDSKKDYGSIFDIFIPVYN
ncbi:MAG: response regulator [Cyanobacteriota bacterium]